MGTQYYVSSTGSDANAGTSTATAKLTISAGCALAAAGDTVNVLPGNYQGSIYINTTSHASGTSASPITLLSPTLHGAKIMPLSATGAGSGNQAAFEIRCNSWVFDGFEVDGSAGYTGAGTTWTIGGTEWYYCVYMTGENVVTQNCLLHNVGRSSAAAAQGGAGVQGDSFYGGNHQHAYFNEISYCGSSAIPNNSVHGIYWTSNGGKILGNLVHNNIGDNITSWHNCSSLTIANNTSFHCGSSGILLGNDGTSSMTNSRIFNNIVRDCPFGIVENGTITLNTNLYDHNCVHSCTTAYSLLNSTATNKTSTDPLMINYVAAGGGNYRLSAGSAAIDGGIASLSGAAAPVLDIAGTVRPQNGTWDLGAYEFVAGGGGGGSGDGLAGTAPNWRRKHQRGYYR